MPTNLLILQLEEIVFETSTNEAWLDGVQFLDVNEDPIALTGISFRSVLKKQSTDTQVWLPTSSTGDVAGIPATGSFVIGGVSDSVLTWNVEAGVMSKIPSGSYLMDVVGIADGHQRRVITGTVNIVQGITPVS